MLPTPIQRQGLRKRSEYPGAAVGFQEIHTKQLFLNQLTFGPVSKKA